MGMIMKKRDKVEKRRSLEERCHQGVQGDKYEWLAFSIRTMKLLIAVGQLDEDLLAKIFNVFV